MDGISLYSINCSQFETMPTMESDLLKQKIGNIAAWFGSSNEYKYFMLLCRERNDYTVFNTANHQYHLAGTYLEECLTNRGKVIDIDYNHDTEYYEIWMRCFDDNEVHMYVVFHCNDFVLEC